MVKFLSSKGQRWLSESRVAVSIETGELKLISPHYYIQSPFHNHRWSPFFEQIKSKHRNYLKDLSEILLSIAFLSHNQYPNLYHDIQTKIDEPKSTQIYRLSRYINIFLSLASEASN